MSRTHQPQMLTGFVLHKTPSLTPSFLASAYHSRGHFPQSLSLFHHWNSGFSTLFFSILFPSTLQSCCYFSLLFICNHAWGYWPSGWTFRLSHVRLKIRTSVATHVQSRWAPWWCGMHGQWFAVPHVLLLMICVYWIHHLWGSFSSSDDNGVHLLF
jgi:ABC-type multidrug transport system permease subunit